jgi:hypothetical protein
LAAAMLAAPTAARAQIGEAAKVRVLLVLDTDDQMGATWGLDGDNMKALLENMVQKQGLIGRVIIDRFTGNKVSPQSVLEYYRKLDVGPDDALMFYYSAHGGALKNKGQFLAFKRGPLFRKDLVAAMDKKKPRLRVVLTDCCANYLDQPRESEVLAVDIRSWPWPGTHAVPSGFEQDPGRRPPPKVNGPESSMAFAEGVEVPLPRNVQRFPALPKAPREEPPSNHGVVIQTATGGVDTRILDRTDGKMLRDLLLRPRGLVDINACKLGQLSLGEYFWGGSVFTNAFLLIQTEQTNLASKKDGQVTWEGVFPRWQKLTDELARAYTANHASQQPQAFQLAQAK